jgi:hypothetical protein
VARAHGIVDRSPIERNDMTRDEQSTPPHSLRAARRAPVLVAVALASGVLAIAGCGSSKPAYCSAQSTLKKDVQGLTSVSNVDELKSATQKIQSDLNTIVNSAKGDFANETAAVKSSVSALTATLQQAASDPQAAAKKLPAEVQAAGAALGNFATATKSKCS